MAQNVAGRYTGIATLMKPDGKDIKSTSKAVLDVKDVGNGKLQLNFSGGGEAIEVVANVMKDGTTRPYGELSTCRLQAFFNEKSVYGWCQNTSNANNGEIQAFWLDK